MTGGCFLALLYPHYPPVSSNMAGWKICTMEIGDEFRIKELYPHWIVIINIIVFILKFQTNNPTLLLYPLFHPSFWVFFCGTKAPMPRVLTWTRKIREVCRCTSPCNRCIKATSIGRGGKKLSLGMSMRSMSFGAHQEVICVCFNSAFPWFFWFVSAFFFP